MSYALRRGNTLVLTKSEEWSQYLTQCDREQSTIQPDSENNYPSGTLITTKTTITTKPQSQNFWGQQEILNTRVRIDHMSSFQSFYSI